MFVMLKELLIPLADLRHLSVRCRCGTQLILDLDSGKDAPSHCSVCHAEFEGQLGRDVSALQRAYKDAGQVKYDLSFRVPAPE